MNIVKQFTIVLLVILPFSLYSSPESAFIHYGLDNGLPSENIFDVEQDSEGYLWIATEAGLSRFNGSEFSNLNIENGLPRNEVVALKDDGYGNVWLNLSGPFSYFRNGKFFTVPNTLNDISWNFETLVNSQGNTWISSKNKLYLINKDKNKFIQHNLTKQKNLAVQLVDVFNDTCLMYMNNHLLFTHQETIVDSIPIKTLEDSKYYHRLSFCFDYPNLFYITGSTLNLLNIKNKKHHQMLDNIKKGKSKLIKVDDGLVLKNESYGFTHLVLDDKNQITAQKKELTNRKISNLFVDKDSNLWVCSFDNGLFLYPGYFKKKSVNVIMKGLENKPLHVVKKNNGEIWVASRENKIARFGSTDTLIYTLPSIGKYKNNRIVDIAPINKNAVLFSTDKGYFVFQNDQFLHKVSVTAKKIFIKDDRILLNTIFATVEINNDEILNSNFIAKDLFELRELACLKNILINERVYTSLIDHQNNYWLSVSAQGLIKIENNDTIFFNDIHPLFITNFVDIIQLNEHFIALASVGNGIFIINTITHNFININVNDDLISNTVNSLYSFEHNLYAGTNKGLSIIKNFADIQSKIQIQNFNKGNGLIYNNIKDLIVDSSGVHLVGQNGYQFLSLKNDLKIEKLNKNIKIEHVLVNKIETDTTKLKSLNYNENNLKFKFALFNYSQNPNYSYVYQLNGISQDWEVLDSELTFHNLHKGAYKLEIGIKALNEDSVDPIKSIDFKIKPHFVESRGMKIIYLFGLIGCLYFIFNFREKSILKKMVKEKTQMLQTKINELAQTNARLKQSNQDLVDFANVCSHDLKTPLRNINSFSTLLYKKHKPTFDENDVEFYNFIESGIIKMYQVIDDLIEHTKINNNKRLQWINTIKLLQEYKLKHKELISNRNVEIKVESTLPLFLFNYSDAKLLFSNLLYNAMQYNTNPYPIVKIGCIKTNQYYKFYVSDNGIGIEEQYFDKIFKLFNRLHSDAKLVGNGVGLALCKKIVEKYNGRIWVESDFGKGSTFYFTILKNLNNSPTNVNLLTLNKKTHLQKN